MVASIPEPLQPRVEALLRAMAAEGVLFGWDQSIKDACHDRVEEARAIVAELPEPVDPDLVAARELVACAVLYGQGFGNRSWTDFRDGACDAGDLIAEVRAALKKARLEGPRP